MKSRRSRRQHGMAVVVVLVLISMVLLYVGGNVRTLHFLNRELKLIEQQQIRRLERYQTPEPRGMGSENRSRKGVQADQASVPAADTAHDHLATRRQVTD